MQVSWVRIPPWADNFFEINCFGQVVWMIKVMYILGLVFGAFAGSITAALSFVLSLNSPLYQVV